MSWQSAIQTRWLTGVDKEGLRQFGLPSLWETIGEQKFPAGCHINQRLRRLITQVQKFQLDMDGAKLRILWSFTAVSTFREKVQPSLVGRRECMVSIPTRV